MATDKKNAPQKAELSDDEIDRLVYEAMCRAGKFVPQTPEEVAEAEAKLNESAVEGKASEPQCPSTASASRCLSNREHVLCSKERRGDLTRGGKSDG